MRITHQHDRKNWISNRRIAVIQKAHQNIHLSIQLENNRLIDKRIVEFNDEINPDPYYNPYAQESIQTSLFNFNRLATSQDLQRVLKHSLVARNIESESEARKVINNVSESLTSIEAERILKNLDYIDNILNTVNVDINKYEALISKLPESTSRKEVIKRCIQTDTPLPASKRQAWLERNLQRGASYNKKYTYKELNQLSRDLERYKTNRLDYEKSIMENKQANREGYENPNTVKTWIWSQLEKTRHSQMDGETIPLASKFEVVNEQNGDVDYLRFPGDIENDTSNCSNICNCKCSYEIT